MLLYTNGEPWHHWSQGQRRDIPANLAAANNWYVIDHSTEHSSNARIVRHALQFIAKYHGNLDFCMLISWARPLRREVHCIDALSSDELEGRWKQIALDHNELANMPYGDEWFASFTRYGWDAVESHVRYFDAVLLLSALLRELGIPYLFSNVGHDPLAWLASADSYGRDQTAHVAAAIDWRDFVAWDIADEDLLRKMQQRMGS